MLPRGSRPWQQSLAMWLSFVSLSSPWPAPGSSLILGQTYGRSPYLETNHPSLIILLNVHSPTPTQIYTIFVTFLFLCALMQFLCLNLVFKHEPIHGSLVHPRIQGINSQAVHLNKSLLHAVYTFECSSLLSYFNQDFVVSSLEWGLWVATCLRISGCCVLLLKLFCDCFHVVLQALCKFFPPAQIVHVWVSSLHFMASL